MIYMAHGGGEMKKVEIEETFEYHAIIAIKHICKACELDTFGTTGNILMPAVHAICDAIEDELDRKSLEKANK